MNIKLTDEIDYMFTATYCLLFMAFNLKLFKLEFGVLSVDMAFD